MSNELLENKIIQISPLVGNAYLIYFLEIEPFYSVFKPIFENAETLLLPFVLAWVAFMICAFVYMSVKIVSLERQRVKKEKEEIVKLPEKDLREIEETNVKREYEIDGVKYTEKENGSVIKEK